VLEQLKRRREQLSAQEASIRGWWNLWLYSDGTARKTVFNAHWDLIPRRLGDFMEPRGSGAGGAPLKTVLMKTACLTSATKAKCTGRTRTFQKVDKPQADFRKKNYGCYI